jgi:coenzyme F420-reducing hydrogenase delta subunit
LGEVGLESRRAEQFFFSPDDPREEFDRIIHGFVERICALGKSPISVENTRS